MRKSPVSVYIFMRNLWLVSLVLDAKECICYGSFYNSISASFDIHVYNLMVTSFPLYTDRHEQNRELLRN